MYRFILLLSLIVVIAVWVKAEGEPVRSVNAALVQVDDCLDLRIPREPVSLTPVGGQGAAAGGLSVRGIGATLGIGLLTIMFFVPAALLSELLMRRGGRSGASDEAWEGSWK